MTDQEAEASMKALVAYLEAEAAAQRAAVKESTASGSYWEPAVAGLAREWASDLLGAAHANGFGGCELCCG